MNISFEKQSHEKLVNDYLALSRRFNKREKGAADDILDALSVLHAAPSLADVPRAYRPHPLKARLKGSFAIDVTKAHRMVFRPNHDDDPAFRIDNYKSITAIIIEELFLDYH